MKQIDRGKATVELCLSFEERRTQRDHAPRFIEGVATEAIARLQVAERWEFSPPEKSLTWIFKRLQMARS